MAIRKYKFKVTSFADLVQFCPKAVESEVIPEHTEYRPVYSVIAKLLEAGMTVPGIDVQENGNGGEDDDEAPPKDTVRIRL